MLRVIQTIFDQLFRKKSVNTFPSKRMPRSIVKFLEEGNINPPVEIPDGFRGRLKYDYGKCIGCALCDKLCPAKAIQMYKVEIDGKKKNKIVIRLGHCTFCQECVNICPVNALECEPFFAMANYEKYGDDQIIGIKERIENEVK